MHFVGTLTPLLFSINLVETFQLLHRQLAQVLVAELRVLLLQGNGRKLIGDEHEGHQEDAGS